MTTVAYRDGIMASDTRAGGPFVSVARKIYKMNGWLVGFSGQLQDGLTFVRWCEAGMDMEKLPNFIIHESGDNPIIDALVVKASDDVTYWTQHFQPIPIIEPFAAVGSGGLAARAAMHMGATAEEALHVAMAVDGGTGGDIQTERL